MSFVIINRQNDCSNIIAIAKTFDDAEKRMIDEVKKKYDSNKTIVWKQIAKGYVKICKERTTTKNVGWFWPNYVTRTTEDIVEEYLIAKNDHITSSIPLIQVVISFRIDGTMKIDLLQSKDKAMSNFSLQICTNDHKYSSICNAIDELTKLKLQPNSIQFLEKLKELLI